MIDDARPPGLVLEGQDSGIATSKVVTSVFDAVLGAIHDGRLQPGQRISDTQLAAELGVSRTPVREALQRLREVGVVEASASRFTRVAIISPQQTAEAMIVWLALYGALVAETVPDAPQSVFEDMAADHEEFRAGVEELNLQRLATANFSFFARLAAISRNELLRKAITSVMHVIRLGALHLPDYIDFAAVDGAQGTMLDAVRERNVHKANEALGMLHDIRIPRED